MNKQILIIAGNFQQAEYWSKQWKLKRRDWFYPVEVRNLYGMIPSEIRYCGTWQYRKDASELNEHLSLLKSYMDAVRSGYKTVWHKNTPTVLPTKIIVDQKFYDVPIKKKRKKK